MKNLLDRALAYKRNAIVNREKFIETYAAKDSRSYSMKPDTPLVINVEGTYVLVKELHHIAWKGQYDAKCTEYAWKR